MSYSNEAKKFTRHLMQAGIYTRYIAFLADENTDADCNVWEQEYVWILGQSTGIASVDPERYIRQLVKILVHLCAETIYLLANLSMAGR